MFTISTRIRYGLRALALMASSDSNDPITILHIAQKENISQKYLENIFKLLKKSRIVRSRRGPEGGYFLDRSADDISAYEIFDALEGPLDTVECQQIEVCTRAKICMSRDFWCDFNAHMVGFLKGKTLSDILEYKTLEKEVLT